jgi:hypothetical protein
VATSSSREKVTIRDGTLILKWDLELHRPMQGFATGKLVALIRELEEEGLL